MNSSYTYYINSIIRNKTFRDGSLFTIFSFFNSGIAFLLLIVIAKFLDPQGYGQINLFNTLVTIIGYIVCLNSYGVIPVNYFRKDSIGFRQSVRASSDITIIVSILILLSIFLFHNQIYTWTGMSLKHQIIALVISSCGVYNNIILNIWRVKEEIGKYGLFSCAFALFNFVLTLFFIISLNQGWEGRINAYLIISFFFLIISLFFLLKGNCLLYKPNAETYKDCLNYGVPLIPHSMTSWLRQGMDRIFLNNYQTVNIVGLFSFSYNFANLIMIIGAAFNSANSVYIFKNMAIGGESVRRRLRKQTILVILFFLILTIGVCLLSPIFINMFFPKYSDCTPYLIFQCFTAFFHCVYLQFVNFLFYFKKTKVLMYITFTISIIHLLTSMILSKISVFLTLWVGLVSGFVIMMVVFFYSRRIYKII